MQQLNLLPPAPVNEAELRLAWDRVPGRSAAEFEHFAACAPVRRALEATVRAGRRARRRRARA